MNKNIDIKFDFFKILVISILPIQILMALENYFKSSFKNSLF